MNDSTIIAAASPYNDTQIPQILAATFGLTFTMAFSLFLFIFVAELLRLQVDAASMAAGVESGKPNLSKFLVRAFLVCFSLFFLYKSTFLTIVGICDTLALAISNDSQWMGFIGQLSSTAAAVSIHGFSLSVPTFLGAAAFTALQYVQEVFVTIRFVLLALLYCVGPLAWALGVSELGMCALRGWFKTTIRVSFWLVVYGVIKAAILPLMVFAFSNGAAAGSAVATLYAIVILVSVYMIPAFTEAVLNGAHLGAISGAAMAYTTYAMTRGAGSLGNSMAQSTGAAHAAYAGGSRIQSFRDAHDHYKGVGKGAEGMKGLAAVWHGLRGHPNTNADKTSPAVSQGNSPQPGSSADSTGKTR
jgi:hypothetical protein